MKLLILYYGLTDEHLNQIRAVSPDVEVIVARTEQEAVERIADADALFGAFPREVFLKARRLMWIQSFSAGMDKMLYPEVVKSDVMLTNASGLYASHAAEHAFALLLALSRGINAFIRHQMARTWKGAKVVELAGGTIGVVGLGGIGEAIAKRGHGFDMTVIAVDPVRTERPSFVAELWRPDRLNDLMTRSDAVMIAAPHTPETERMIGRDQLWAMKPNAYLVNVSRGKLIDEAALVEALQAGRLAGAGLDVFETEPLPPDSPLWGMENVVITTHAAGGSQHRPSRMIGFFCENLRRFIVGEPLLNVIDKRRGF